MLFGLAFQDRVDLVVGAVLVEQVVIHREALGRARVLHVLGDQALGHGNAARFIDAHHARQVVPAAGRDERLAVERGFDMVEIGGLRIEVRDDGRMHARCERIGLPCLVIGLHVDALEAVPRGHVEIVRAAVVLGRIAGRDHHPALRHLMAAEHLVLQKLQDGGRERLRDAVDLVQEQDAFLPTRFGHGFIDRRDDFAHRVFGHAERLALEGALGDIRQAEGALTRVVRHGIAHQPDAHLARHLLHDGGLAHAGRAD